MRPFLAARPASRARLAPTATAILIVALSAGSAMPAACAQEGEFKLRGYLHYDVRDFSEIASTPTGESSELRRVRPIIEYKSPRWSLRVMPDLARESNLMLDAYVELTPDAPWDLRIGRFKSPLSIDRLRSVNALALTETSLVAEMTPNRDNGVLLGLQTPGKSYWRLESGVFDGAADGEVKGSLDEGAEWTLRALRLQTGPAANWRIGVGASGGRRQGEPDAARLARYRTPGRSTWFRYAGNAYSDGDSGRIAAFADYYGGPWFAQAEAIRASETVRRGATRARLSHRGWELQAGRVLTGENRTFEGVVPANVRLPALDVPVAIELSAHAGELRIDPDAFTLGLADGSSSGERLRQAGVALGFWFPQQWRLTVGVEHATIRLPNAGPDLRERVVLARLAMAF